MTTQKSYYRFMLGKRQKHADQFYQGKFIGVRNNDFWNDLPEYQDVFIEKFSDS